MNWKTILAIDNDKAACEVYRANMPGVEVRCSSVADQLDALPDADVLIGGPPCQDFSTAGKGAGAGGERNAWPEAIEAVRRVKPRMFLFENVPGMLQSKHLNYAQSVYQELCEVGYRVEVKELDAVNYGVPQFRKRCWWWGIREDVDAEHRWPEPTHQWPHAEPGLFGEHGLLPAVTVGEALRPEITGNTWHECEHPSPTSDCKGLLYRWSDAVEQPSPTLVGGSKSSHTDGASVVNNKKWRNAFAQCEESVKIDPKFPCNEIHKPGVTQRSRGRGHSYGRGHDNVTDGFHLRRLTPRECARLQSCPDDMIFPEGVSKTALYRVIGNGWASGIAAHLSRALHDADPESRTVIDLFCGGGPGSMGWHGRYWSFEPAPEPL